MVGEREKLRFPGPGEDFGAAWRRPSTHQFVGIAIVPEANGVPDLMRDHIQRNVRQVQWLETRSLDADDAPAVRIERSGERHEVRVGEQDGEVAGEATRDDGTCTEAPPRPTIDVLSVRSPSSGIGITWRTGGPSRNPELISCSVLFQKSIASSTKAWRGSLSSVLIAAIIGVRCHGTPNCAQAGAASSKATKPK